MIDPSRASDKNVVMKLAGLHLEINPRGGEMSIYEKEGGGGVKPCVRVSTCLRLLLVHSQGLCIE